MYKLTLKNVADFCAYWLEINSVQEIKGGKAYIIDDWITTPTEEDVMKFFGLNHEEAGDKPEVEGHPA